MDLLELARTIQHDRDRSVEQTVRLRRLLAGRTDLPGRGSRPEEGRVADRGLSQVAARPGSPR